MLRVSSTRQLVGMRCDGVGEASQQPGTIGRRDRPPCRCRCSRSGDGRVDRVAVGERQFGDDLGRGGVAEDDRVGHRPRFWQASRIRRSSRCRHGRMMAVAPHVLIVGRLSAEAKGVRGEAFAGGQGYFRSVERAGGVPLMLPPIPALLDRLPALLVALRRVGAARRRRRRPAPLRPAAHRPTSCTASSTSTTRSSWRSCARRWPSTCRSSAICRGMQIVNVALGGTLVQHIGTEDHWFASAPGRRRRRQPVVEGARHRSTRRLPQRASPVDRRPRRTVSPWWAPPRTACRRRWRSTTPRWAVVRAVASRGHRGRPTRNSRRCSTSCAPGSTQLTPMDPSRDTGRRSSASAGACCRSRTRDGATRSRAASPTAAPSPRPAACRCCCRRCPPRPAW